MVGRLVQKEGVDLLIHEEAQLESGLFAARQHADRFENFFALEIEGCQPVAGLLGRAVGLVQQGVHQIALGVVKVDVLGQITRLDTYAVVNAARHGGFQMEQSGEQGGLSAAVGAKNGDALTTVDHGGKVLHQRAVIAHRQVFDGEDVLTRLGGKIELVFHLALFADGLDALHAVDALLHGKGTLVQRVVAHKGPQVQVAHRLFQSGDLLILTLFGGLQLAGQLVPLFGEVAVITRPVDDKALPQLQGTGGDVVQEIAVVGYDQNGAAEGFEITFQPLDRVHVQMVGRLVQQQQVGARQHEPGQVDPGLFAARQAHEGTLLHIGVDLQTAGHAVIGHLQVVAAAHLKGGLQAAVAVEVHLLPIGHKSFHAAHLIAHALQIGKCLPQDLPDGGVGVIDRQLFQQSQSGTLVDGYHAAIVLLQAGNDL